MAIDDSETIVARIRAIDDSLEPFVPLYLHLLSVPSESHPLPRHLQGEHLQAALLDALSAVVASLASHDTLVVLLEDWHWADSASSAALHRIAEVVAARGLLFVVTTRPERAALDELPSDDTRLQLDPLDFAASTAIMRAVLGVKRVSDELAVRVFERTGGNPFFLEQVCSALLEQGAVATTTGEALVEGGADALSLPDTVQAVIRTRLDKLEPAAREVLRVASVIGRDFEHGARARRSALMWISPPALARLKASGLIRQTGVGAAVRLSFQARAHPGGQLRQPAGPPAQDAARPGRPRHRAADTRTVSTTRRRCWPTTSPAPRPGARRSAMAGAPPTAASSLSQFADALAMLDQVLDWLEQLPDDEVRRI